MRIIANRRIDVEWDQETGYRYYICWYDTPRFVPSEDLPLPLEPTQEDEVATCINKALKGRVHPSIKRGCAILEVLVADILRNMDARGELLPLDILTLKKMRETSP